MGVQIRVKDKSESQQFLQQAKELLDTTQGPLRLGRTSNKNSRQEVLFLRERTLWEFCWEKLIMSPQQIADIENEALAAIELALFPFTSEYRNAVLPSSSGNDSDNDFYLEAQGSSLMAATLKDELKSRVLEKRVSYDKTQAPKFESINGLCAVPKGFSVSTCPALQVIAHNVIVGSVGAVSVPVVEPYSPLARAVKAFKNAWRSLKIKSVPLSPSKGGVNQTSSVIVHDVLPRETGLRHIQKLMCIADDRHRNENDPLAKRDQKFWEDFYRQGCETMEGSVVRELYPDYYVADRNAPSGRKPFYSDENIKGAVSAAAAVRAEMRQGGKEPLSIMFAGMDSDTYTRMCDELRRIDVELGKVDSNPSPPPRKKLPKYLISPDKFPAGVNANKALERAVRLVPEIRKNLKSKIRTGGLDINSDSESDSGNDT